MLWVRVCPGTYSLLFFLKKKGYGEVRLEYTAYTKLCHFGFFLFFSFLSQKQNPTPLSSFIRKLPTHFQVSHSFPPATTTQLLHRQRQPSGGGTAQVPTVTTFPSPYNMRHQQGKHTAAAPVTNAASLSSLRCQ